MARILNMSLAATFLVSLMAAERNLSQVRIRLSSSINCGAVDAIAEDQYFFDRWLIKEPGTATPWHNDMPYWPVGGRQICSVWVALDPVRQETGAVEYVKGSHRCAQRCKPASFSGGDQYKEDLRPVPDIEHNKDEYDIVSYDLEPGDCTVHHGYLVHGSPGNASTTLRRRAYVSRWKGHAYLCRP